MCAQADSCMACWYSCSLDRGTGPSGHTPSEGGMFTSESDGCSAVGAPGGAVELGNMSEKGIGKRPRTWEFRMGFQMGRRGWKEDDEHEVQRVPKGIS